MNTISISKKNGIKELPFGLSPDEVMTILGKPKNTQQDPIDNCYIETRDFYTCIYSQTTNQLAEVTISPIFPSIIFEDVTLPHEDDLILFFSSYDPNPFNCFGFIVFSTINIALGGYLDDSDKTLVINVAGQWDALLKQSQPYNPQISTK